MRFCGLILFLIAFVCVGCSPEEGENGEDFGALDSALVNGSPEGIGFLDFLNDADTTLKILDIDAGLNKRTAKNLIHHRNGWDQDFGTYDDNLFNSIEEVDAVSWVGPKAMSQILEYSITHGWIPQGIQLLGAWDGVAFSVIDAESTLILVNEADLGYLDHDLGLDKRAAESIVEAQPISTIAELSKLYYVGKKALNILKAEAASQAVGQISSQEALAL